MDKIGIIGLGYVGLPLLWTFHQVGEKVIGFDVDPEKINSINAGKTYIKHFKDELASAKIRCSEQEQEMAASAKSNQRLEQRVTQLQANVDAEKEALKSLSKRNWILS